MNKKLSILVLLLIATILIMACSIAGSDAGAPAAPENAEEVEQPIEAPVEEVEPTPVPDMDISGLVLTSADFPDVAFTDVSPDEMGISIDDFNSEDFTVESFFVLLEPTDFEMVMGFTTFLQSTLDRVGFDLILKQPEVVIDAFVGGMGDIDSSQQEELPELNDIADSSAGVTLVINVEGIRMRVDMVIFRHDSIGSFIIIMYLDGEEPIVPLKEVTLKFDEKIAEFLANQ